MASYEAPMLHHQPFDDGIAMTRQQQAQNPIWFNSAKVKIHSFIHSRIRLFILLHFILI